MKSPVRERVFILLFETLAPDVLERVFAMIKEYSRNKLGQYAFVEEWRKIPQVKKPLMTDNGNEPDWSQMKLSVFRIARLIDKERGILIQLSENFLTINAIPSESTDDVGDIDWLVRFYREFVPCIDDRVGLCFKNASLKSEVVYAFDQEMLQDFIIDRNNTGKRDYLDIQNIIHPGIESKPDGFDMNPPLHLSSHYSLLHQGKSFKLELGLDVEFKERKDASGWQMCLNLMALSRESPEVGNQWGAGLLQTMSDVQYECIQRLLTKDACEKLKVQQ